MGKGVASFGFDRTGTEPNHSYDLAAEVQLFDIDLQPGSRRVAVFELEQPCATDRWTARVCLTQFDSGKVLLWGEFADGDRCWIREDDAVARAFMEANASLFLAEEVTP